MLLVSDLRKSRGRLVLQVFLRVSESPSVETRQCFLQNKHALTRLICFKFASMFPAVKIFKNKIADVASIAFGSNLLSDVGACFGNGAFSKVYYAGNLSAA